MQQIVLSLVIVQHATCLRLHGNTSFPLHVQLVQHLLVAPGLNGARELEKPVAEGALAMVDVSDNAEVTKAFNWDGSNSD
jgi:hypothetical protein